MNKNGKFFKMRKQIKVIGIMPRSELIGVAELLKAQKLESTVIS